LLLLFVRAAGRGAWHWLLAGLIASGAANALIGVYQFFGGSGALHLLIDDRFFRAFGTFGQPNPFGGFMGLLAPLAAAAALGGAYSFYRSRARRDLLLAGFYAAATALLLVGLLMSWSRGAWLGFAAAAGVVTVLLPRRAWMGGLLLLAGASLLASLWAANLLPVTVTSRITSATAELFAFDDVRGVDITTANYAVVERLSHWQAALNMARAHPWLGVGMGNYEYAYPTYRLINWPEPLGHAHNYYLNMLAEGGLIGLIGYGKAWLLIVFLTWRAARHPDIPTRLIAVGLLGSWTYLLVHSIFDNLYVNNLFLHIGIMLGIAAVLYDDAQRYVTLRLL
jgi:O-antigen ligase